MKGKAIVSLLVAFLLSMSLGTAVFAEDNVIEFTASEDAEMLYASGTWKQSSAGWWYSFSDGTYAKDGFYQIDGKNYYFNKSGYMVTGWLNLGTSADPTWYYFNASGVMCGSGWQKINNQWYYFTAAANGRAYMNKSTAAGGRILIGGKYYYFYSGGALLTGWKADSQGNWRYYTTSGEVSGWQKIGEKWYYFEPDNNAMVTGFYYIDEKQYHFSASGAMDTGWFYENESGLEGWYYTYADGSLYEGWAKINNKWYYFEDIFGVMATGSYWIESDLYFFADSGEMKTGWVKDEADWHYCESSGRAHKGWLQLGDKWYYFDPDTCVMYHGSNVYIKAEGRRANFDANGVFLKYVS